MTNPRSIDSAGAVTTAASARPPLGPHCFTLAAQTSSRFVGEVEGGYRVDVDYRGSSTSVRMDDAPGLRAETRERLRSATLLSGNDWVFVSKTGVASFDSRITLAIGSRASSGDRAVIGGRIRGRADLRLVRGRGDAAMFEDASDGDVMANWIAGFGDDALVPLGLSVVFEVPTAGFDRNQSEIYADCRDLERASFIALGRAVFRPGPNSPFKAVELEIYRLPGSGRPEGRPRTSGDASQGGRG